MRFVVIHNDHKKYESVEDQRHSSPETGDLCGPLWEGVCSLCRFAKVYEIELTADNGSKSDLAALEAVWVQSETQFLPSQYTLISGGRKPKRVRGISVGDVIYSVRSDALYKCDNVGWTRVVEFNQSLNDILTVEV